MTKYASGRHAFGFCDRTGFRYRLPDLVPEYIQGIPTGLRIGRDVADPDHPQNFLGRYHDMHPDPQIVRNPRPDLSLAESRRMFSWGPVGVGNTLLNVSVGSVTVT